MNRFLFCPDFRSDLAQLLSLLRSDNADFSTAATIFKEIFNCQMETLGEVLGTLGLDRVLQMLDQLSAMASAAYVNLTTGAIISNPTLRVQLDEVGGMTGKVVPSAV